MKYLILKNDLVVYILDELPRFKNNVLAYPIKALDIKEDEIQVVEAQDIPFTFVGGAISYTNGNYIITNQDLYENTLLPIYKEAKLEAIKQARESLIVQPIDNVQVKTPEDRENLQGSIDHFEVLTQGLTNTITWTMADNTEAPLTKEQLQGIVNTYVIRKALAFQEYQTKKVQIEQAESLAQLELI